MKQYAARVEADTQEKEKTSVMLSAVIAGKEMQSKDGILWYPSTSQTTNPSLRSLGWSDASINTRLDPADFPLQSVEMYSPKPIEVVEEGLDDPNYYR